MPGTDSDLQRQLHAAIEAGDPKEVRRALKDGAPVNELHYQQGWPLSHAVGLGNDKVAKVLLEAGADPNLDDWMRLCIERNDVKIAKLLVRHGVNLNGWPTWEKSEEEFETSLIRAVRAGRYEIAKLLVEGGADVNRHNWDGEGALLVARLAKSKKLIKLLEPRVSEAERARVEERFSAEYAARLKRDAEILKAMKDGDAERMERLFKESGRDVNTPIEPDRDYPMATAYTALMDYRRPHVHRGTTPPREAQYRDMIYRLAAMGARADLALYGGPPLDIAATGGAVGGGGDADLEFVRFLLDHSRQVDCRDQIEQATPLMSAALQGQVKTAALLMERGADPNARDARGRSVLTFAKRYEEYHGPNPCIPLLVAHGATE